MRPRQLAAWLSGTTPAQAAVHRAGRPETGWQAAAPVPLAAEVDALHTIGSGSLGRAESDLRPMAVIHAEAVAEDAAWAADGQASDRQREADPFSPEDREQLRDEAERLGVTPELVVQRLGMIEDRDGLWRDREAGE